MRIVIPTYRRPAVLTLRALHPALHGDVALAVRPDERERVSRSYPDVFIQNLPPECDDLLKTRQWIWEAYAPHMRFCMLDDDIRGFEKKCVDGSVVRVSSEQDQRQMFADLEAELDRGAGIVSPRTHYAPPNPSKKLRTSAADVVQFFMLDGPRLVHLGLRWDRIRWVEDCDFVLQVLSKGIDVVHVNDWSFSAMSLGEGEGGLNFRPDGSHMSWGERAEIARKQGEELARLWPGYVVPSSRKEGHWTVRRAALLKDSREKKMETSTCPGCGEDTLGNETEVCSLCQPVLEASGHDPIVLENLGRYLRGLGRGKVTKSGKRRGRPALGNNHPVLLRMRDRGPFRVLDVADLYGSRNSANVSLANMVKAGRLRRVGTGVYQVPVDLFGRAADRPAAIDPAQNGPWAIDPGGGGNLRVVPAEVPVEVTVTTTPTTGSVIDLSQMALDPTLMLGGQ